MDVIEWIMPSLIRIYQGGEEIGKFDPRGPEDEEAAQVETDVCNWYLEKKNDLFSHVSATLKDSLLLKNGYMIGLWCTRTDMMSESYFDKSEEEVMALMDDPEVTVVAQTPKPDPVSGQTYYDIEIERKKAEEYVRVESVPPDELIVSRRHRWTSLVDADFVEWVRRNVTIGELRAEGFQVADDEFQQDSGTLEAIERDRFATISNPSESQDETNDPSRRVVTLRDAYIRMDLDGVGQQKLWRIVRIDGSKRLLLKEKANIIPFAAFSPIVYPHSHVGISVYDLIQDIAAIKTTLERQSLDGIYLQNSGRVGVDVNKLVNLDDLLVSRPGGIVRFDGDPSAAMLPIQTPDASQAILGMLEFVESEKEARTGVTRYSAGLDANTLNKTATGVQQIQAAANQRIELIARTLAGGFRDLFLIVHALASQYCTRELQIQLNNKWVLVDPREWKKRTDFSISVGLGTGTPEQQLQKLMGMMPVIQQEIGMGLAGPREAYNFGVELWKAAGFKLTSKFIQPPKQVPQMGPNGQPALNPQTGQPVMVDAPPPQQPNPLVQVEQVKAQSAQALAQQKAQSDAQLAQVEAATKTQIEGARAQADMLAQQHEASVKAQSDLQKTRDQLALDNLRHDREQQTAIKVAALNAASHILQSAVQTGQFTPQEGLTMIEQMFIRQMGQASLQ